MPGVYFYTIGLAFLGGVFLHSFFNIGTTAIALLAVINFGLTFLWFGKDRIPNTTFCIASLGILFFVLGLVRMHVPEQAISTFSEYENSAITFEGIVVREPDVREKTVHLYVEIEGARELLLVTTDKYQDTSYGDRVLIEGALEKPESFQTDLGRTFNYPGYLKAKGVRYMVPFAEVSVLGSGEGNIFLSTLFSLKHSFMRNIEQIIKEPEAGLGEGLLLGVKRALGADLEEVFRVTGIIHIVVLSGYNVMLVAEGIMRLLAQFFFPRTRLIIGVGAILSFAILVGLGATVVRASLMAVLVLVARATGRTYAVMRALLLAGVLMVVWNPYVLAFDPGFQLSFLATLGLIFLAPLIEERLHLVPTRFQIREFLTATIATQIFVLPLLLYLMGAFSLISVVVNVLVLPMVPVAMLLTFLAGIVTAISSALGMFVGLPAFLSLTYIITIATLFSKIPAASVTVPPFPFWIVVVSYIIMGALLYRFSRKEEKGSDKITNDYADWVIEEETEDAPEERISLGALPAFPFK